MPSCATVATTRSALYNVQRRALAGILATVRGPSTFAPEDAPVTLDARLHAIVDEHVSDSDEGRRTALRHQIARRLLDDPVVYADALESDARAYFVNQRGALAARLGEATGMSHEQRAEGLALIDDGGALTDVAMPAEGTEAHATLLVAEHLASRYRCRQTTPEQEGREADLAPRDDDIARFLHEFERALWPLLAQIGSGARLRARARRHRAQSPRAVAIDRAGW